MKYQLPNTIPQNIFRAYDIRGIVDTELTPEIVYAIGLAIGTEAKIRNQTTLAFGRDARLSGPVLKEALLQGLLETGVNIIDIGIVPTPVLYFATYHLNTRSGVMLTASHNPADYNGIKAVLDATTLAEHEIQGLYQRIVKQDFVKGQGSISQVEILDAYVARICSDVKLRKKLKVVIDCGNGVAGVVAPKLFRTLGCEVIELFCEVDGRFPNHHPDPSVAENLQDLIAAVHQHKADLGIAFDGDSDRLGVVTNTGKIIWPDRQMMLFARDVLSRNPHAEIIFDVKCSKHLPAFISKYGGKPLMWKTGHSILKAKLQERNAPLAGEMSGHVFFKERWYGFDDGMYVAARLLEILANDARTVTEIFEELPDSVNTPELKLPMSEEKKSAFLKQLIDNTHFDGATVNKIDGLRVDFADGWGLIRASNTTPCLTLRFEADSEASMTRIQNLFRQQLLAIDSKLALPF